MVIEQAWGMMLAKFSIFSKPIQVKEYSETNEWKWKVRNIIICCMILHNMCRNEVDNNTVSDSYVSDDESDDELYSVNRSDPAILSSVEEHNRSRVALTSLLHNTFVLRENKVVRRYM